MAHVPSGIMRVRCLGDEGGERTRPTARAAEHRPLATLRAAPGGDSGELGLTLQRALGPTVRCC